jgi:hypothetical protein
MIRRQVNDDEQTTRNAHALSGIRTHGHSVQAINAYASDGAATHTFLLNIIQIDNRKQNLQVTVLFQDAEICIVVYITSNASWVQKWKPLINKYHSLFYYVIKPQVHSLFKMQWTVD